MRRKLSDDERHGDVSVCGRCQDVHIRWDNLVLSLKTDQFDAFARMVTDARSALGEADVPATIMGVPKPLVQ